MKHDSYMYAHNHYQFAHNNQESTLDALASPLNPVLCARDQAVKPSHEFLHYCTALNCVGGMLLLSHL